HLAARNEPSVSLHGFFRRRDFVVEMRLIEIDAVGLQAAQRGLTLTQDVIFFQAAAFAHVLADLGGDQHTVAFAAAFDPITDDSFRLAARITRYPACITVGGVDGIKS